METGAPPLFVAAQYGQAKCVKVLIDAKARLDAKLPSNGRSALFEACAGGHVAVVNCLMTAKADIDLKTADGATPLFAAANNGHIYVVDALLNAKALPNARLVTNNCSAIAAAAAHGHADVVYSLLAHFGKTDCAMTTFGLWEDVAPLLCASHCGHADVVRALLSCSAEPDPRCDSTGVTPLLAAAIAGHASIARQLLLHGANPRRRTMMPLTTGSFCPRGHVMMQHPAREAIEQLCQVCHVTQVRSPRCSPKRAFVTTVN